MLRAVATMDESFKDIVSFIDNNYRTIKSRNGRAVCGLSMGGGHTFHISMRYPETFNYYGLFSAGLHLDGNINPQAPFYEQLKANKDAQNKLKRLFSSNPKLYWIAIGNTDFLYNSNTDLRKYLDEMGYKYEYRESDGGHIWRNWRIYRKSSNNSKIKNARVFTEPGILISIGISFFKVKRLYSG